MYLFIYIHIHIYIYVHIYIYIYYAYVHMLYTCILYQKTEAYIYKQGERRSIRAEGHADDAAAFPATGLVKLAPALVKGQATTVPRRPTAFGWRWLQFMGLTTPCAIAHLGDKTRRLSCWCGVLMDIPLRPQSTDNPVFFRTNPFLLAVAQSCSTFRAFA